jgi:hypothetical protein
MSVGNAWPVTPSGTRQVSVPGVDYWTPLRSGGDPITDLLRRSRRACADLTPNAAYRFFSSEASGVRVPPRRLGSVITRVRTARLSVNRLPGVVLARGGLPLPALISA